MRELLYYDGTEAGDLPDLLCLSHQRWDERTPRSRELLSRFARERRVIFFEPPVYQEGSAWLSIARVPPRVWVVIPFLPPGLTAEAEDAARSSLLGALVAGLEIESYVLWYDTPAALAFSRSLSPLAVVYDRDPPEGGYQDAAGEAELTRGADLVLSRDPGRRGDGSRVYLLPPDKDELQAGGVARRGLDARLRVTSWDVAFRQVERLIEDAISAGIARAEEQL
jgi:hypothetical protein